MNEKEEINDDKNKKGFQGDISPTILPEMWLKILNINKPQIVICRICKHKVCQNCECDNAHPNCANCNELICHITHTSRECDKCSKDICIRCYHKIYLKQLPNRSCCDYYKKDIR